jgi:hypothetical protein
MHSNGLFTAAAAVLLALVVILPGPGVAAFQIPCTSTSTSSTSSNAALPALASWAGAGMGRRRPRPRALPTVMATPAGPNDEGKPPLRAASVHHHDRRATLQRAGALVLGPLAMVWGAGSAGAAAAATGGAKGEAAGVVAGASAHKSLKELQFELMKQGLEYTCVRAFVRGGAVVCCFGDSYAGFGGSGLS